METLIRWKYTKNILNLNTTFKLKDTSITGMNKLLLTPEVLEEDISSNVPWHINGDCIIVVDLRKLEDRENITYDCWSWKNDPSYVVSGNENGPLKKCNDKKQYRVVKRRSKCKDHNDLEKYIVSRFKPNIYKQQVVIKIILKKLKT